MDHDYENVVAICPRCKGTIEIGQKVYVVGEHQIESTGELSLIANKEKICESCYPRLTITWPDHTDHEHGDGDKALDIILRKEATATG